MSKLLILVLLVLSSCTIFVEEPGVVVETHPVYYHYYDPYYDYSYVWVRDPITGQMVRRAIRISFYP